MGIIPYKEEFEKNFRRLDKDGDGNISLNEMLADAKEEWNKLKTQESMSNSISDERAFIKGIEWFTEIVFFYGVLVGICYWEFNKVH